MCLGILGGGVGAISGFLPCFRKKLAQLNFEPHMFINENEVLW